MIFYLLHLLAPLARRLHRDDAGSVAITFGIAAVPIVLAMGAAVDYSLAHRAKTTLDTYADAAALAVVGQNYQDLPADKVKEMADALFTERAKDTKRAKLKLVAANVTDTDKGRTAVIKYVAEVPTAFMGLVSINDIKVEGQSSAFAGLPTTETVRIPTPYGVVTEKVTVKSLQMPRLTK